MIEEISVLVIHNANMTMLEEESHTLHMQQQ